jgi:hypothetical protein
MNNSENPQFKMPSWNQPEMTESFFTYTHTLIIVLVILLIIAILAIISLTVPVNIFENIKMFFFKILSYFGYATGSIINKTADVTTDITKFGIDIADGTVHSIGDLLKNSSIPNIDNDAKTRFDNTLNLSNISNRGHEPSPDNASNPIQNPIATSKTNWCLVGESDGKRGCVEVGESDKCISNQLFPSKQLCLNPTLTK